MLACIRAPDGSFCQALQETEGDGRSTREVAMEVAASVSRITAGLILALSAMGTGVAAYPERPIRVVVPYGVGGPADLCLRAVADAMQASLGQALIIENITGATGNIGLER